MHGEGIKEQIKKESSLMDFFPRHSGYNMDIFFDLDRDRKTNHNIYMRFFFYGNMIEEVYIYIIVLFDC